MNEAHAAPLLRTAAVWGTTVLAVRHLHGGDSFVLGEGEQAALPKPDGAAMADRPVRAVGTGWELDARGASGGVLYLRGRTEDPAQLGRSGAPIPIVPGDYGLLQYGSFGVFFQFTPPPPRLAGWRRIDWTLVAAFFFSLTLVGGGLGLLALVTTPRALSKPVELTSREELVARLWLDEEPPPAMDEGGGQKSKEPGGAKKDLSGGKKAAGREGALGRRGNRIRTDVPDDRGASLGGISDVLASDVGEEVQRTLGAISSVAEALGGLHSDELILGRGPGLGLRGRGAGGGGDSPGVPFGAGTLDTGAASGAGRGRGSGAGGRGGTGVQGAASERKVAGAESARPGQGLTPAQISRVVMSRLGAFRACYESAASRQPGLQGGVTVSFSIAPGGSVSAASVASSSLGNQRVEGCILRQFRRLRFPTADKPTNASYPFLFKPGKQ